MSYSIISNYGGEKYLPDPQIRKHNDIFLGISPMLMAFSVPRTLPQILLVFTNFVGLWGATGLLFSSPSLEEMLAEDSFTQALLKQAAQPEAVFR